MKITNEDLYDFHPPTTIIFSLKIYSTVDKFKIPIKSDRTTDGFDMVVPFLNNITPVTTEKFLFTPSWDIIINKYQGRNEEL